MHSLCDSTYNIPGAIANLAYVNISEKYKDLVLVSPATLRRRSISMPTKRQVEDHKYSHHPLIKNYLVRDQPVANQQTSQW